ncbi:TniQ family protein [Photobacterium sp. SP02]|uniref:TniQ family protein n=1 Tax=Photobacterium sp. SP02 TaxID=3032280 RepID=UPI003144FA3F
MFLITPDNQYADESLESFLIRVCECNGYESFQLLSGVLWAWLVENDHQAAGALPRKLSQINLYHAKHSSGFRVRAMQLLDSLFEGDIKPFMGHAVLHSSVTFSPGLAAVFRDGLHIPRCFLREQCIPVCSQCLAEQSFIRQFWHIIPYQACHIHGVKMLYQCPECQQPLNYQEAEQISVCACGCELSKVATKPASGDLVAISKLVVSGDQEGNRDSSISHWLGALLWFSRRYKSLPKRDFMDETMLSEAVDFFSRWPVAMIEELDQIVQGVALKLTQNYNHTKFSDVFGDLLTSARKLPSSDLHRNFVLKTIVDYLEQLVRSNPKKGEANIADLQLSILEASALLSSSTEQVYRLYEEGYLQCSKRLKLHSKLSPDDAVFYLRQIIELRSAGIASDYSANTVYLPSW